MNKVKRLILWTALILGTGVALALTSCAGLKVSIESELDTGTGLMNFLNGE